MFIIELNNIFVVYSWPFIFQNIIDYLVIYVGCMISTHFWGGATGAKADHQSIKSHLSKKHISSTFVLVAFESGQVLVFLQNENLWPTLLLFHFSKTQTYHLQKITR